MHYSLDFVGHEAEYLAALPLSERAWDAVADFVETQIANMPESARLDPTRRLPGGRYLGADFSLVDFWGDRKGHTVAFIIDDSSAPAGVLRIVYAEHHCSA